MQGCASVDIQTTPSQDQYYKIERSKAMLLTEDLLKTSLANGFLDSYKREDFEFINDIFYVESKGVKGRISFVENEKGLAVNMRAEGKDIPVWEAGGTGTLLGIYTNIQRLLNDNSGELRKEKKQQLQRIALKDFSCSVPNEDDWLVVQRNADSVQLAKQGNGADETYAIQARSLELPQFYNDEAFILFIEEGIKKYTDGSRFIEKKNEISAANTKHGTCIKFESIHEDLSAKKRTNNSEPMFLEVIGTTCRNPHDHSKGAYLVYSNRYYSGNQDSSLSTQAQSLLNSLEFVK